MRKLSTISHLQSHPAYFTGNPYYFDALLTLNRYIEKIQDIEPITAPIEKPKVRWMNDREFLDRLSIKTSEREYLELRGKLDLVYSRKHLFSEQEGEELQTFLEKYMKPDSFFKRPVVEYPKLDEYGRSVSLASRKTSKAQVYLIPGKGEIMVNGEHLSDYFQNDSERVQTVKALDTVDVWGKFNIWAIVNGGGKSSQAGAVGLGIARGLILHEPNLESILKETGLLKPDTRQVERKKTGQPKARKKIAWVKR